jgi:hypothetical protein
VRLEGAPGMMVVWWQETAGAPPRLRAVDGQGQRGGRHRRRRRGGRRQHRITVGHVAVLPQDHTLGVMHDPSHVRTVQERISWVIVDEISSDLVHGHNP